MRKFRFADEELREFQKDVNRRIKELNAPRQLLGFPPMIKGQDVVEQYLGISHTIKLYRVKAN